MGVCHEALALPERHELPVFVRLPHLHDGQQSLRSPHWDGLYDNLKAIEKNKAAKNRRKTLTVRLSQSAARLDVVMKRLIELELQTKELALRFDEAVKGIKIALRS
jgi:hypothetical protein